MALFGRANTARKQKQSTNALFNSSHSPEISTLKRRGKGWRWERQKDWSGERKV